LLDAADEMRRGFCQFEVMTVGFARTLHMSHPI
jgi:hypothetical protein